MYHILVICQIRMAFELEILKARVLLKDVSEDGK